jgi:ABC-type sugar transport system ATPase subunit
MIYVTHDQIEAMTLGEKIILFNEGTIQQISTPKEVYESPSNLFVATFIGSPGINLFEGKIVSHENTLFFRSAEFMIDVGKIEELQKYTGEEVTLGIRPESLAPGDGPIYGNVEIIEHIGPETIIYLKTTDTRLIAKAPPDFSVETGSKISFVLSSRGMLFFHNRIRIKTG